MVSTHAHRVDGCKCGAVATHDAHASNQELDVRIDHASPLRGVVRWGEGPARAFEGWVELAGAVEACLAEGALPEALGATGIAV